MRALIALRSVRGSQPSRGWLRRRPRAWSPCARCGPAWHFKASTTGGSKRSPWIASSAVRGAPRISTGAFCPAMRTCGSCCTSPRNARRYSTSRRWRSLAQLHPPVMQRLVQPLDTERSVHPHPSPRPHRRSYASRPLVHIPDTGLSLASGSHQHCPSATRAPHHSAFRLPPLHWCSSTKHILPGKTRKD